MFWLDLFDAPQIWLRLSGRTLWMAFGGLSNWLLVRVVVGLVGRIGLDCAAVHGVERSFL